MPTSDPPSRREVGFLTRWRRLPKEALSEAERSTPIFRTLDEGVREGKSILLRYRGPDQEDSGILLDPRELYKSRGYLYVRGKSYPSGKFEAIRLDHILEASLKEPQRQDDPHGVISHTYLERKRRDRPSFPSPWRPGGSVIGGPWGGLLDFLVLVFIAILIIRGIWFLFTSSP